MLTKRAARIQKKETKNGNARKRKQEPKQLTIPLDETKKIACALIGWFFELISLLSLFDTFKCMFKVYLTVSIIVSRWHKRSEWYLSRCLSFISVTETASGEQQQKKEEERTQQDGQKKKKGELLTKGFFFFACRCSFLRSTRWMIDNCTQFYIQTPS